MKPLLEELVVVNGGCVPMRVISNPLGAPVVAVALKQDARIELKLILPSQEFRDLCRPLREQPQALVNVVPGSIFIEIHNLSKYKHIISNIMMNRLVLKVMKS